MKVIVVIQVLTSLWRGSLEKYVSYINIQMPLILILQK